MPRRHGHPRGRGPDVSRSSWSRTQRWKNDALFLAVRAALELGLAVPRSWLPALGSAIGTLSHALFARARRTTLSNLELVQPELRPEARAALARSIFRTLGRNLTDTVALLDPTEAPSRTLGITCESREVLDAALGEGRGVIYATCHLGPWERMAALLAALGYPITALARRSYDPRLENLIYPGLRTARNIETIHRGSPSAAVAIVRALRRGRVLGVLVDLPGRNRPEGEEGKMPRRATSPVTWLGRPSSIPLGPARLALRTGAPIVIGTPAPGGAKLWLRIARLSTEGCADETELCQRIADALSERIRALPEHWPWMHRSFGEGENHHLTVEPGRSARDFRLVQ
jgi:lauroyl/myristoyl acyltransferase